MGGGERKMANPRRPASLLATSTSSRRFKLDVTISNPGKAKTLQQPQSWRISDVQVSTCGRWDPLLKIGLDSLKPLQNEDGPCVHHGTKCIRSANYSLRAFVGFSDVLSFVQMQICFTVALVLWIQRSPFADTLAS